ncbi:MAG: hypothetical protein CVT72_05075 [Alphaproteobacteria bacterium HGW-Alphaproteobacteria-11]|nr:MAG: hypothetical protein CVT72_05075 [Alphaproteobacteria bacterium HGW-Alphaproteobacteria-11]
MRKILALAGIAVALGFGAPAVAQAAVTVSPFVVVQGDATLQFVGHKKHHGYHGRSYHRGQAYQYRAPKVVYHRNYRPWSHWRPHVTQRSSYHSFGRPAYYHAHPRYGDYYHVRARDRNNVAVWLGISAITGAILFSSY